MENELVIEYDGGFLSTMRRGRMCIYLDQFMEYQSLSCIKKLLKVIWHAYNPENAERIRQYCNGFIKAAPAERRTLEAEIDTAKKEIKINERLIKECIIVRGRYKKNSSGWKYHQTNLDEFRARLAVAKESLRESQRNQNRLERLYTKYEKVLHEFEK